MARGRRPGESRTRRRILEAARVTFNEVGYDAATVRLIAARAGVDPALLHHFFGTKRRLFMEIARFPFDPAELLESILEGDPITIGRRIAESFFAVWGTSDVAPFLALVRSAASHDDAARLLREVVSTEILGRIVHALGTEDARLRASLVGSQIIGMVMARYIVRIEPIASAPPDVLIPPLAATIQRYLTGPLGDEPG